MSVNALNRVFDAATALVKATPALGGFSPWPDAPALAQREPTLVPVVATLHTELAGAVSSDGLAIPQHHQDLIDAILASADDIEWRRTYTEQEVGADFMRRYGYFELLGPSGHFFDQSTRAFIGYWGTGLHYPWHAHQAEELYFVIAGSAEFAVSEERCHRGVGDTQLHTANQPHAMTTAKDGHGILTFVMWRGDGLDGLPAMTPDVI